MPWLLTILLLFGQTQPAQPGGRFLDDDGSLHEGAIEAIASAGITQGCYPSGDLYCPDDPVTRGQMATFLVRALRLPPSSRDAFSDDDGSPHEAPIQALAAAGVTRGCAPERFCPHDPVTRAQMASFLVAALGLAASEEDAFSDDDGWRHEAIGALAAAGITRGCGDGRYCPKQPVTRAEMATFLARALDLDTSPPPPRTATACTVDAPWAPTGNAVTAGGDRVGPGGGQELRFRVEVEEGLPVDPGCVADVVTGVLFDRRGWRGSSLLRFSRVGQDPHFRIILASPATTDQLCRPLRTGGRLSCRVGDRVVLNFDRWLHGAPEEVDDLAIYRAYLINHEVGHWLGEDHRNWCPQGRAPVMAQQTIEMPAGCVPNGWPLPEELDSVRRRWG